MADPDPLIPLAPRAVDADHFEQNPRAAVQPRIEATHLSPTQINEIPEAERVREAVRRVIQDGTPIHEVARSLHLSASSIRAWKSKFSSFLQAQAFGESNPAAATEDAQISALHQTRFTDNWERLLEKTHASQADFKQDPLLVFLQTNSATNWLYDEEGKLEWFSLSGLMLCLLGLIAVWLFLTTDKGDLSPTADFRVDEKAAVVEKPRYDLDVDRAGAVVQDFLHADGYIAKLGFLRDRATVEPVVREFYQKHSDQPINHAVQTYGMVGHGIVSIAFDVPTLGSLFFNLVPDGRGYLIDWFTSTLYQTDHIENFVSSRSSTPTMLHVQVEREEYFNYEFTAEKYACFRLKFPGLTRDLMGYAPLGSPLAAELLSLTASPDFLPGPEAITISHATVLEARYPTKSQDQRQVEIVKFISKDWLPY